MSSRAAATSALSSLRSSLLRIRPEVSEAISTSRPVVALESTIVAHGMPYPQNVELAREVEEILRLKGVIPATIAIKDGVCRVGLSTEELDDLARAGEEGRATKCSTRDLPLMLASMRGEGDSGKKEGHRWGATTVASTMHLANLSSISTFVTGGTGGVHRSGQDTLDISSDLIELSRTPVVVVSAGVKSILDIPRTLEYLETHGVPAVGFGTDEFPAFFSKRSGVKAPLRVDTASEVADAYWFARGLGLSNGMLIGVPNDDPAGDQVEGAIHEALREAEDLGVEGRDVTPFVLKRVSEQTRGESLRSNMSLVRRNADVGGDIAIEVASMARGADESFVVGDTNDYADITDIGHAVPKEKHIPNPSPPGSVIVMGGSVVDLVAQTRHELLTGTSNPGTCNESDGGVGRNVAETLGRLGSRPTLFSAVGNDSRGLALKQRLHDECNVDDGGVRAVDGANTATYAAVLDCNGELHTAVADMEVLSNIPIPSEESLRMADMLILDANPTVDALTEVATAAVRVGTKVFFEPTSVPKASVLGRRKDFLSCLTYAFPNVDELMAMADGWTDTDDDLEEAALDNMKTIKMAAAELLAQMRPDSAHVIVTLGADGALLASRNHGPSVEPNFAHFPVEEGVEVKNCTGAGDTLCGAFVHAILEGRDEDTAVRLGMDAAMTSLRCEGRAISPLVGSKSPTGS